MHLLHFGNFLDSRLITPLVKDVCYWKSIIQYLSYFFIIIANFLKYYSQSSTYKHSQFTNSVLSHIKRVLYSYSTLIFLWLQILSRSPCHYHWSSSSVQKGPSSAPGNENTATAESDMCAVIDAWFWPVGIGVIVIVFLWVDTAWRKSLLSIHQQLCPKLMETK